MLDVNAMPTKNILYISHGGGPLPLLGDPAHSEMVSTLTQLAEGIEKPSAIIVVSAHWEASLPNITSHTSPPLIYDYYGFPEESYSIAYPAPGAPGIANEIFRALNASGIKAELNLERGFDHGVFIPGKIMYPNADIPCVQLSLVNSLDPLLHIEIGRALKNLPIDNLLVMGSGFSFHNMRAFFTNDDKRSDERNDAFQNWLLKTVGDPSVSEEDRANRLIAWEDAPHARYCHPREEHLLPLHVCYGLANKASDNAYSVNIMNKQSMMFHWVI